MSDNEKKALVPFPIPVVSTLVGAGSQPDDGLDYMTMPKEMETFHAPILPEPEALQSHPNASKTLKALLELLSKKNAGEAVAPLTLLHLAEDDLNLINQVLGEGEVSITIAGTPEVKIQETVFVGVWRVVAIADNVKVYDALEVSTVPNIVVQTADQDAQTEYHPVPLPEELVNVPFIVEEIRTASQDYKTTAELHNVNLTLLPLTEVDIAFIDNQIGTGRIVILSRGYGNCRIVNTCTAHTWRLVFYNSQDKVILNSVEVSRIPEVACAAPEDFIDSEERLREVLAWLVETV